MRLTITLTTTGRRSGQPRSVTLYAFRVPGSGALVVIGSYGGAARDPAWAGNLRASPAATVREGRAELAVTAREVQGEERDRLWQLAVDDFPLYATYERKTRRTIPVFLLEP
ncbi:MAG TPA: nitroreductase family deazaflavin-dependent oxidoreductase, partial [Candidatus Limnocylindria bacterium]|nr:nitroreductase family deazaflavin-dependent oxidoreductase [Candidatus Limnocylindria bacterium]